MSNHLYFIANPYTMLVKIGIAWDVKLRCDALRHAAGVPLVVLASLANGERFEKPLHFAFDADRALGEWFAPSDALLSLVDAPETISGWLKVNEDRVERGRLALEARKRGSIEERAAAGEQKRAEAKRLQAEARAARQEAKRREKAALVRAQARRDAKLAKQLADDEHRRRAFFERRPEVVTVGRAPVHEALNQRIRNAQLLGVGA